MSRRAGCSTRAVSSFEQHSALPGSLIVPRPFPLGPRTWLDSWSGIGVDLQLTQYDERGWRATFYMTGMGHSAVSATGTG